MNSFSKWCLQYSPVPVIVVRPPEKRLKKKNKRGVDPTRQDYARILKDSGVESHETRGGSRRNSVFVSPPLKVPFPLNAAVASYLHSGHT